MEDCAGASPAARLWCTADEGTIGCMANPRHTHPVLTWLYCTLVVAACRVPPGLAQESKNPHPVIRSFEELEFRRPIPIFAPEMAALWGDRSVGASGNEEKQPAGKSSALHVHPNDTHALVIQGRMTHAFEGQPAPIELGPGAYYTLPAEAPHVSTCLASSDCLIAYWQPGKLGYKGVRAGSRQGFAAGVARPAAEIQLVAATPTALPSALLWGDPAQGRIGTLVGQEPDGRLVERRDTGDIHGIVIIGTASVAIQGGETRTLGPGSYYMVPAGATLASRCDGPAACRYLHFQPEPSRTAAAGEP